MKREMGTQREKEAVKEIEMGTERKRDKEIEK